uniref:Ig-like domain-containing protein n=1 Tax=Myotis lucifugus TaxID=59463 RepID=G1QCD3_MYOLU
MSLVLPTLLYLGLYLTQSSWVQEGSLPPPVITAQPGSMVLYNEPVTILCQGPPDAETYEIYKVEEPGSRDRRKLLVAEMTDTLYIQEMKPDQTGLYRCSYESGEHWSLLSDPLHVVMTGSYDKPSLSSMSGTVVAPGDNVALQCFSRIKFDAFILTKEDAPQFTQRQSSTAQDNGQQTTFHMDHVTSTQAGTYRCYGAFTKDPYVWSHPSKPLQLVVRGKDAGPSPRPNKETTPISSRFSEADDNPDPTEPHRPHGPAGWSVSRVNQVRLSLASLVLLVLVVLVAEACYSHKRSFYRLRSEEKMPKMCPLA